MQLLGQGATIQDLSSYVPTENGLPEGSQVQLDLQLRYRFPGFETGAGLLASAMSTAGATAWRGYPLVQADATAPVYHLRWVKGQPFLPVLLDILGTFIVVGVVIAILVIAWHLYRAAAGAAPGVVYGIVGLLAVFVAFPLAKAAYHRLHEGA